MIAEAPRERIRVVVGLVLLAVAGLLAFFPPAVTIPLDGIRTTGKGFDAALPDWMKNVTLREDGAPLGAGYHVVLVQDRTVVFSPRDGSDPRANGRSYEVVAPRTDQTWYRALVVLCALAGVLVFVALPGRWRRLSERPCPGHLAVRVAAIGVVPFLLTAFLMPTWNAVQLYPDTEGYVAFHDYRTAGYPWFIALTSDAAESERGVTEPRVTSASSELLSTVRAQKIVGLLSLLLLGLALTRGLSALEAGALLFVLSWMIGDSDSRFVWSAVLSDPLANALILVALGLTFRFTRKPGWSTGVALGVVAFAAILVRPSSQVLWMIFPVLWLVGNARTDWRQRSRALLPGVVVTVVLSLVYMGWNAERIGYFGFAPFMQFNLMGNVFETADPQDGELFEDPALRRFVSASLSDGAALGITGRNPGGDLDRWIYLAAAPHLPGLVAERGEPGKPWHTNVEDLTARVNRTLLRRHPGRFVAVVYGNMVHYAGLPVLLLLASYAFWLVFVGGLGTTFRAFVAVCAVLPLVSLAMYSTLNVPNRRYMAIWFVALGLGLLVHGIDLVRARFDRGRSLAPGHARD